MIFSEVNVIANEQISKGDILSIFWDELEETYKARRLAMEDDRIGGIAKHSANKGENITILTY